MMFTLLKDDIALAFLIRNSTSRPNDCDHTFQVGDISDRLYWSVDQDVTCFAFRVVSSLSRYLQPCLFRLIDQIIGYPILVASPHM